VPSEDRYSGNQGFDAEGNWYANVFVDATVATEPSIPESEWMGGGNSPLESPAPMTTPPGANQNVRAAFERHGANAGDEFGPADREADWENAKAGFRDAALDLVESATLWPIGGLIQPLRASESTDARGRQQRDFARRGLGGVVTAASVVLGGVVAGTGFAEAGAARGSTVLFHGTDLASAESIVARGLNAVRAARLGGGDSFWTTANRKVAGFFAHANPAGGPPAVVQVTVPQPVVSSLLRQGTLEIEGATHRFSGEAWKVLNEFATFVRVQ
jgi:hypothetical protein